MSFKVGSIDQPTSTGNQAYTGIGFQPKGLILFTTNQTAYGNIDAGVIVQGFSDGTNDTAQFVEVNADADTTSSGLSTTQIINNTVETVNATVNSFDSDGFTLNWGAVEGTVRKVGYVAFGGALVTNVEVGSFVSDVSANDIEVNLVGSFQPDCVLFFGNNDGDNNFGFGWTVGTSVGDEAAISTRWRSGASIDVGVSWANDRCFMAADDTTTPNSQLFLSTFDADGFTLSRSASTDAQNISYMAIKGGNFAVGNFQSPIGAGEIVVSGESFSPEGILFLATPGTTVDSDELNSYIGVGAADSSGEIVYSIAKNLSTDAEIALLDTKCINLTDTAGTVVEEADIKTLDSGGFTVTYTTAETDQNRVFWLMFRGTSAVVFEYVPILAQRIVRHSGRYV